MANKILNTPGGNKQVPAGKVLVGDGYTGDLATFNGKIFVIDLENLPDPLNPLNLPPNTIRVKFKSGYTPDMGDTQTLVDATNNVWDICRESNDWLNLLAETETTGHNLLEVLGANTKNVTNMRDLFYGCSLLTNVNIFNTSNVTSMWRMFGNCKELNNVPLFDTSNVTDMRTMFGSCIKLTTVPKFNTNKVRLFGSMFWKCTLLTNVPIFDTSNALGMQNMFSGCTSLIEIPLFDISNVTNMEEMFMGCSSLTTIPLFDTSNITNMDKMFYDCRNIESGALALYQQASTQTNIQSHFHTFYLCGFDTQTGRAELAQIPSDWK